MKRTLVLLLLLSACTRTNDDLAPWANCQSLNLKFGVESYEQCVEEQEWRLSDEQQRKEFEPMQTYLKDPNKP
jgi:Tfp pilus assembly protein PilP